MRAQIEKRFVYMFIFNFKIDGNKTAKILMGILCIVILIITAFICYKVIFNNFFKTNDTYLPENTVYTIEARNYTNVLQQVHNDIDTYVGQKIKFTGYVYRIYDFTDEQFVIARDMVVSSDFQTVVVGFLCHSTIAKNFENGCWVEIEGTITKGDYYGEMPIIEIEEIDQVEAPDEEYVYPPDDSFVTTSTVL